jgi:hypothetical protein
MQGKSLPGKPSGLYLLFRNGDRNSFRDSKALPVDGDVLWTTLYGHDYIPSCVPWQQETRIYRVNGWGSQRFSIYQSTSGLRGTGSRRMVMNYIQSGATLHKKHEWIWFKGGELNVIFKIWNVFLIVPYPSYGNTSFSHDRHIICCYLTQGARTYIEYGWRIEWFSRYTIFPWLCPTQQWL